jgi:hypothetical protein
LSKPHFHLKEKPIPAVSKHDLHKLIDALPEGDTLAAKRFLEYLLSKAGDSLLRAFLSAPEDDEPLDEEDLAHLDEAERDLDECRVVAWEDVKQELGR